jgi:hypothetical protein
MNDDPRWPVGLASEVESAGNLVEGDDPADAGQGIQSPRRDRVERAIPVLGHRATTELDGHSLPGGAGDVQCVAGVPTAGTVDSGSHRGGIDDLLDQARGADTFEDDRRPPQTTFAPHLTPDVEWRPLRGIDQDVRAETVTGKLASVGLVVRNDDRLDIPGSERRDRGPVLRVRNKSSPGPGTGSGVSRTSSWPPLNTTARTRPGRLLFSNTRDNRLEISTSTLETLSEGVNPFPDRPRRQPLGYSMSSSCSPGPATNDSGSPT